MLLRRVLVDPCDVATAAIRLAEMQGAQFERELLAHVEQLLSRLEELGLVDRVAD